MDVHQMVRITVNAFSHSNLGGPCRPMSSVKGYSLSRGARAAWAT